MSRPLRIEFPQAVYHVMNRGAGRHDVFVGKEDNENFLETLAETHTLCGGGDVCILPDGNLLSPGSRIPDGNLYRVIRDGLSPSH